MFRGGKVSFTKGDLMLAIDDKLPDLMRSFFDAAQLVLGVLRAKGTVDDTERTRLERTNRELNAHIVQAQLERLVQDTPRDETLEVFYVYTNKLYNDLVAAYSKS